MADGQQTTFNQDSINNSTEALKLFINQFSSFLDSDIDSLEITDQITLAELEAQLLVLEQHSDILNNIDQSLLSMDSSADNVEESLDTSAEQQDIEKADITTEDIWS